MKKLLVPFFASLAIFLLGCSESSSNAEDALAEEDGKESVDGGSSKGSDDEEKVASEKERKKEAAETLKHMTKGSFKDSRDGQTYKTVTVGDYTWMAENLRYTLDSSKTGDYGSYYTYQQALMACPSGWHLSIKDEWCKLETTIESVYDDSAGWALKSTKGWAEEGNGKDAYGFNIQPGGAYYKDELRDAGKKAFFWTQENLLTTFDLSSRVNSSNGYGGMFYSVRCVNNENTMFEALGDCNAEKQDVVSLSENEYYICDEWMWRKATHDEKLKGTIGECTPDNLGARASVAPMDTNYTCSVKNKYSFEEQKYVDVYDWNVSPKDSILADCLLQGDTLCRYFDTTFVNVVGNSVVNSDGTKAPVWHVAGPEDVFGKCIFKITDSLGTVNGKTYICRGNYWDEANEADIAVGSCTESKEFETVVVQTKSGSGKFVCIQKTWNRYDNGEHKGFCNEDGARKNVGDVEMYCDAKKHVWIHEFKDERDGRTYKSVLIKDFLMMAENLKYGGDSLFTWSEALGLDRSCDSSTWSFCPRPPEGSVEGQGICPDGWILLDKSNMTDLQHVYDYNSSDGWIFVLASTSGWPLLNGTNESGLDFKPFTIYTKIDSTCHEYVQCLREDEEKGNPAHLVAVGDKIVPMSPESYCMQETSRYCDFPDTLSFEYNSGIWVDGEEDAYYGLFFSISQTVYVDESKNKENFSVWHNRRKTAKAPVRCKKKI